jgi:predicted glycosyltransferase
MKEDEKILDINHLPWVQWLDWMYELSKCKYGVQLGTAAAGTFNLNCAYLGIPCIAYDNVNTQKYLHPELSVPDGDIKEARKLAEKLKSDENFYKQCSDTAKNMFETIYSEKEFLVNMKDIVSKL